VTHASGLLLVQTEGSRLTVLDAERGRTLWSQQVGVRGRVASEASANKDCVAVLNGSRLYVLDRATGAVKWQRTVGGVPGAAPECGKTHLFVPMIGGLMEAYALDGSTKATPWIYKSAGRVHARPTAASQTVSWPTERGFLYVVDSAAKGVRYRLETRDAIHGRPAYWTPHWFAASSDGYLYAVDEATGNLDWKVALGEAIYEPPVAINDKVFVVSGFRGLICIDAKKVAELWTAPGIEQFLAASPARVYACDTAGRLTVLDIASGARLASMPLEGMTLKVVNGHSDRIFLGSDTGIVQCLREVELKAPVVYTPPPPPKRELPAKAKEGAEPKAEPSEEPTDAPLPAEPADEAPAAEDANDMPAVPESEDPFGGTP
jgi:outer membrane protein assembly factor BamB